MRGFERIALVAEHAFEVGDRGVELGVGEADRGDRAFWGPDRLDLGQHRLGGRLPPAPARTGPRRHITPAVTAATSEAAIASSAMPTDQRR